MKDKCSYFGCEKEVCERDKEFPPPSMRFCQEHSEQLESFITANPFDPKTLLSFWIKANGGAKRLSRRMMEDW